MKTRMKTTLSILTAATITAGANLALAQTTPTTNPSVSKSRVAAATGAEHGNPGDDETPIAYGGRRQAPAPQAPVVRKIKSRLEVKPSLYIPESVRASAEKIARVDDLWMATSSREDRERLAKLISGGLPWDKIIENPFAFFLNSLFLRNTLVTDHAYYSSFHGSSTIPTYDPLGKDLAATIYSADGLVKIAESARLELTWQVKPHVDSECPLCREDDYVSLPAGGIQFEVKCGIQDEYSDSVADWITVPTEMLKVGGPGSGGHIDVNVGKLVAESVRLGYCDWSTSRRYPNTFEPKIACQFSPRAGVDEKTFEEAFHRESGRTGLSLRFEDPTKLDPKPVSATSDPAVKIVESHDVNRKRGQGYFKVEPSPDMDINLTYHDKSEVFGFLNRFIQNALQASK